MTLETLVAELTEKLTQSANANYRAGLSYAITELEAELAKLCSVAQRECRRGTFNVTQDSCMTHSSHSRGSGKFAEREVT